jgi:phosphatidylethanolamine/phosphatidyl-N-methylethanolamine N-methyltransferase
VKFATSPEHPIRAGDHLAADTTVFFGLWLQKPLHIAATNPSSARLADAFARCVELARPGPVLELGAGTGSITRGLVRAGCPPDRILAVGRKPRFAAMLRRNLPGMTVIEGDATEIGQYLAGRVERLCAVVSSLPISGFRCWPNGRWSIRVSTSWDLATGSSS